MKTGCFAQVKKIEFDLSQVPVILYNKRKESDGRIFKMPLEIIRNDITKVKADVIVNSANPKPVIGHGVDSAIYDAAGKRRLLRERKKIGDISPGQCAATKAFRLDADYIIHTVGPVWQGGEHGEREAVKGCYRNSLDMALVLGAKSIAFPLISTGNYGFPKDEALSIAISEIGQFLFENEMDVYLVVYDKKSFMISEKLFRDVKSYIEDHMAQYAPRRLYSLSMPPEKESMSGRSSVQRNVFEDAFEEEAAFSEAPGFSEDADFNEDIDLNEEIEDYSVYDTGAVPEIGDADLDDIIKNRSETFQEMLFRIIDRKGFTDSYVYKKANMDRRLFSKIRSNVYYKPSKYTAVALAIALELNLDETKDLLLKAGIALSPSNVFDLIIEYCIIHKITDIFEVNSILYEYDQKLLGA